MQWQAEGLIIGVRRHGETSVIVEAMVAGHGRHLGLVRGGRSSRRAPVLQPGNTVVLTWRARLEEHLGQFTAELLTTRAASLISDRQRLYLAQLLCEHLRLLPERDPHDRLLAQALALIDSGDNRHAIGAALARFELSLLDDLGFGLDLTSCAATGSHDNLTHISPKSGHAVSRQAAQPYLDRLLPLPCFLTGPGSSSPGGPALREAFALTGHFLDRHLWAPRRLDHPATREPLIEALTASMP